MERDRPERDFVPRLLAELYPNRPAFYHPERHDHLWVVARAIEEDAPPWLPTCIAYALSDGTTLVVERPFATFFPPGRKRFHGLDPRARKLAHAARREYLRLAVPDPEQALCETAAGGEPSPDAASYLANLAKTCHFVVG